MNAKTSDGPLNVNGINRRHRGFSLFLYSAAVVVVVVVATELGIESSG